MCEDCWMNAGSPDEWTAKTGHLLELVDRLYVDHSTGGPLHAVLDDWNLDGHIEPYRPLRSDVDDETWQLCEDIAAILNRMTEPQRYAALAYQDRLLAKPGTITDG